MKRHVLRIKKQYFRELSSGRKSIEVRVGYGFVKAIKVGDKLTFENYGQNEFNVIRVTRYNTLHEMLDNESVAQVLPGLTKEQAFAALRGVYPERKERLGVYVLQLERA